MANSPFVLGGLVNLDTIRSSESGPGPYMPLQTFHTTDGGEYIYLRMNASQPTLQAGRFVLYKPNGSCAGFTSASAPEGWPLAMAKNTMTTGQYGFFCINGRAQTFTGSSGLEVLKPIYLGKNYGELTTATASAARVFGVAINANIAVSTTANCILHYPRVGRDVGTLS